jgi:arylsulfate sulfotransferase
MGTGILELREDPVMKTEKTSCNALRSSLIACGKIAIVLALTGFAMGAPVVSLSPSVASPQPLGTSVTLTASATDTDAGAIAYRFQVGAAGSSTLTTVRDYSVETTFVFTPMLREGYYQFVVTARNNNTLNTGSHTITAYQFTTLVTAGIPVVTPAANPLVALFSSPACPSGGEYMRVNILPSGATYPSYTSWKACGPNTLNFVVAGMRASTLYSLHSETWNGSTITAGPSVSFSTGTPTVTFPTINITTPFTTSDSTNEPFLLIATLAPTFPFAIDWTGAPVWYYDVPSTPTRPVPGGTLLLIVNGPNSAGTPVASQQVLREIDLAGNVIRETNATRIAEQVSAMSGIASQCYVGGTDCLDGAFHHEAIRLPNGHTLAMTDEEQIFTDGTQGSSPANPVDIIGDIWVDLDANFQVTWYWRAFDWLNANRAAILGETCAASGGGGCPPIFLTTGIAQDWLHSNALYYTPSDGSVLMSMRHQDWIIKVDYNNATGAGDVLWTLGLGGDFTINSTDPYPWFSHQHDPGFVQDGATTLAMFDNGNTRVSPPPIGLGSGDSRGYVLNIDQTSMTATPVLLQDLGVYSAALGTAELLSSGDYHFEAGIISQSPPSSEAIEVFTNSGTLGFSVQLDAIAYRSFRMTNLDTPPDKD